MSIGSSIFLVVVGAILYFATNFTVSGVDIDLIGVILMVAGVVGLLLSLLVMNRRTKSSVTVDDGRGPVTRTESRSDTAPMV